MKTKKFRKKLSLNKKTVADLNQGTMKGVRGGVESLNEICFDTIMATCATGACACPPTLPITCDCTDSICYTDPCRFCIIP